MISSQLDREIGFEQARRKPSPNLGQTFARARARARVGGLGLPPWPLALRLNPPATPPFPRPSSSSLRQDPNALVSPLASPSVSHHDLHHLGLVASGNLLGRGGQSSIFPIEGELTLLQRSASEQPAEP